MAEKNFTALEEELDVWFEEEKERLTNSYFKQVEMLKKKEIPEEEGAVEDPLMKKFREKYAGREAEDIVMEFEKVFLSEVGALRTEYQKKYDALALSKARFERMRRLRNGWLKPVFIVLDAIWAVIKFIFAPIIFMFKMIAKAFKFIGKTFSAVKYRIKEFYTFHMKRNVDPILNPLRFGFRHHVTRPMNKFSDKMSDTKKKIIDSINSKIKKFMEKVKKILAKLSANMKAVLKKVSEFNGKVKAAIRNLQQMIKKIMLQLKKIFGKQ